MPLAGIAIEGFKIPTPYSLRDLRREMIEVECSGLSGKYFLDHTLP
jgi:hypothetical protein